MNAVSEDVEKLVEKELEAANERFPQFHSSHEGWAVIREEAEELRQETDDVEEALNILWERVRYNMQPHPRFATKIKERAIAAACEAIQVAAIAQKYLDMLERMEKEESE
jgi:hypothetical protein